MNTEPKKHNRSRSRALYWASVLTLLFVISLWWHHWSFGMLMDHLKGNAVVLLDNQEVDFGEIPANDFKTVEVQVCNTSLSDVTIIGSDQTCQCAGIERGFLPVEIPRGSQVTLPVVFVGRSQYAGQRQEQVVLMTSQKKSLPIRVSALIVISKSEDENEFD